MKSSSEEDASSAVDGVNCFDLDLDLFLPLLILDARPLVFFEPEDVDIGDAPETGELVLVAAIDSYSVPVKIPPLLSGSPYRKLE